MDKKDYDGPLYAPWSKVVEGRGFDPVEERRKAKRGPLTPVLMFLGVIIATLSVIVAGYFNGKMNIGAVWHNLNNFN